MDSERYYLIRALSKAENVVIIKQYDVALKQTRLIYISPNASTIGLNVDSLKKGYKLLEDYILPEDRNKTISMFKDNYYTGGEPFHCEYRIVDDSGKIRWIKNHVSYEPESQDTILIEYLVQDVSAEHEKTKIVNNILEIEDKLEDDIQKDISDRVGANSIKQLVKSFAGISGLYSAFIDTNGKNITEPVGPMANIGEFYDLFERPNYKKLYQEINEVILVNNMPVYMELEDGNSDSRLAAAPIFIGTEHVGTWLLCAYTKEEANKLKEIYEKQWCLASLLSEYLYSGSKVEKEMLKNKRASIKYEIDKKRCEMIIKALNSEEDGEEIVETLIGEAGEMLAINNVFYFAADTTGNYFARYRWSNNAVVNNANVLDKWYSKEYFSADLYTLVDGAVVVDSTNMSKDIRAKILTTNINALMAFPISLNNINKEHKDWLVFASTDKDKIWNKDEIKFADTIRMTIDTVNRRIEGEGNIRCVNKQLIDTYNFFKVGIFIRDAYSGEVLYSNKAIDAMLGYEFTGKDSRTIITDLRDKFYGIDAMRKPFITKNKEVSWRSYVKALDSIMDITEIQMEWFEGRTASLIIIRNAQD